MGYKVYIRNKKTKAGERGIWPEKKRIEAVTTYLTTGKLSLTSAMTGVPEQTLRAWKRSDWWKNYAEEMQYAEHIEIDKKLAKVMDSALDQVMDRLENGEYMYDPRTGKVKRIPAKLRDVGKITTDMIDKRHLIKKVSSEKPQTQQQITADHLVKLAQEFAKFATGKNPEDKPGELIEGEASEVFEHLGVEEGSRQ
jgi:hypothetical protein